MLEPVRSGLADANGKQPGDPERAAAAILQALDEKKPPLRLALGSDAVESIAESLERARAELTTWKAAGRGADFPR